MCNGYERARLSSSATALNSIAGEASLSEDADETAPDQGKSMIGHNSRNAAQYLDTADQPGATEINGVMVDPGSLYGPPVASKVWGFSLATLASRRCRGLDAFFKRGRTIQYLGADLIASWKAARVEPGDEPRSTESQRAAAAINIKKAREAKRMKATERRATKATKDDLPAS